jgi:hypothetical protein
MQQYGGNKIDGLDLLRYESKNNPTPYIPLYFGGIPSKYVSISSNTP